MLFALLVVYMCELLKSSAVFKLFEQDEVSGLFTDGAFSKLLVPDKYNSNNAKYS